MKTKSKEKENFIFLGKSLFFPDYGIIAIGDLHIGYEYMLQQSGISIPEQQAVEIIDELKQIFKAIEKTGNKIKKIIFLGDIKHSFAYKKKEKDYFNKILGFLKDKFKDKNIILIKGNHDTIDYSFNSKMKKEYLNKGIYFTHGHKPYIKMLNKRIKTIVIGHLHPSIILSDNQNIKREKYKCFLVGKYKDKRVIILPSFLATAKGTAIEEYKSNYKDYFSIIPKKDLMKFKVYIIGKEKVYEFGKVKDLN